MQRIFQRYGIEILTEDGKYYISYDAGGIVIRYVTIEVSEEDAIRAQKSENVYCKSKFPEIVKLFPRVPSGEF